MSSCKDYVQTNQKFTIDGQKKLRVSMDTREFGLLVSRTLPMVADDSINEHLLNSLGEELIDDYEQRLTRKRNVVAGWL